MRTKRVRIGRGIVCLLVSIGITGWAGVHLLSEPLLTPRKKVLEEHHLKMLSNPVDYGLKLEPMRFAAPDGIDLDGLWVTAHPQPGAAIKLRRMRKRLGVSGATTPIPGLIVMLHGRHGCKEDCIAIAERFGAAGFDCLLMDLRAHGQSGGRFSTYGRLEAGDVSAVIDGVAADGRSTGPIGIWGISLGGAVALQAAATDERIDAVVSVNAFGNLKEVTAEHGERRVPKFGRALATLVLVEGSRRSGANLFQANPASAAAGVHVPVVIIHAEADRYVPATHGRQIYESLRQAENDAEFWRVPEATHGSVLLKGGDDLYQEMIEFFLTRFAK